MDCGRWLCAWTGTIKTLSIWPFFCLGTPRWSYPGLPSHPQHALDKRQQSGFGGVLSFWLDGGLDDVRLFFENIKGLFALAESLGGVESLLAHPATMSHASLAQEERVRLGITDNLIRVSVGIESFVDLERDVSDALSMV